jgi:hypothetical protein
LRCRGVDFAEEHQHDHSDGDNDVDDGMLPGFRFGGARGWFGGHVTLLS